MSIPTAKFKSDQTGIDAPVMAWPRIPPWLAAVLLALTTLALFWPALHCDFIVLDDPDYVTTNIHVQNGLSWENVVWAFSNPVNGNWHPLTVLSLMLDCQWFGMKPWGFLLTNVLLHTLNAVLAFVFLRQATGTVWRSLLVAALFAVHPLRVESVAWVAERKDVLSVCFGLLTLLCYARAVTSDKWQAAGKSKDLSLVTRHSSLYWLALVFFAFALMSKPPMMVTLPCVMLLLDYWPLQRFKAQGSGVKIQSLILEKVPFLALVVAASAVSYLVLRHAGALGAGQNLPLDARIGNALISYCRYLGKLFWPTDLAVFYPHPGFWSLKKVFLAGAFLLIITRLLFTARRQHPFLLMGWLWFGGMLVPVIGLVQVGAQAMADRYTYLPSLGVLILVVWGAHELTQRWRPPIAALALASAAAIIICFSLTRQQLGYWRNSEILFRHTLAVTKNNDIAHNLLGVSLIMNGQTNAAIREYQEALRLNPQFFYNRLDLAIALSDQGHTAAAIEQFKQALRLYPNYAPAHYNLGSALLNEGRTDEGMNELQEAVRLEPDFGQAFSSILNTLAGNNEAWSLATNPDVSRRNGARAVQIAERVCEATQYRMIIPVGTLAAAYAEAGRFDEAIATGQKACTLATEMGNTNLLKRNQELVKLYQTHQPYHEPAGNAEGSLH